MKRLFLAFLLLSPGLALTQTPPPAPATVADVLAGTATYKFISPAAAAGAGLSSPTNGISASAVTNIVNLMAPGLGVSNSVIVTYSDTYAAWVSKAGSDTTGSVGHRELPFLTVSNAVRSVKAALGTTATNGVVYVGSGVYGEYWVNLQRTNLAGISLIGVSPQATMLTSVGTSYLTNLGPLVVLGHNSTVANLSISNNINAGYKQAAIGWDASRGTTAGTTFVVPTNIFIQNVIGQGNSDVGYFYDSGSSYYSMWLDKVDFESKWDAFFLSTAAFDGQVRITKSSIRVYQPDDYGFPDGGSGAGRARAVYVGEGFLSIADTSVIVVGGSNTVNETTALTHFGSTEGYTNMNTALSASSTGSGAVTLEYYSSSPNYIGKVTPGVITTNEPYANSVPLATSYRTAKQINLFTNQNNWSGSNYWAGLTKFAGPVGIANLTATDGSTWSLNNLLWSMSSGKMAINGGAINYTNDPNGLTSWWDVNAADYLLYLEPDGVGSGPRVYLYNPFGNAAGFTNLPPTTGIAGWPANSSGYLQNNGSGTLSWGNPAGGSVTLTNTTSAAGLVVGGSGSYGIGTNLSSVAGGTNQFWVAASPPNEKYTNLFGDTMEISGAYRVLTVGTNVGNNVQISDGISSFPNGMWIDAGAQEYFVGKISVGTERGQFQLGSGGVSNLTATGVIYAPSNHITGGISAGSISATTLNIATAYVTNLTSGSQSNGFMYAQAGGLVVATNNGVGLTNIQLSSIVSPTNVYGATVTADFSYTESTTNMAGDLTFTGVSNWSATGYNHLILHCLANGANRTITPVASWQKSRSAFVITNGTKADIHISMQFGVFTNISQVDFF